MKLFLRHLTEKLDLDSPGWRDDTIILWDNAPYHTSTETQGLIDRLGLQVIYSGPYSFSAAPIETLFSQIKLGDLSPDILPTGKK